MSRIGKYINTGGRLVFAWGWGFVGRKAVWKPKWGICKYVGYYFGDVKNVLKNKMVVIFTTLWVYLKPQTIDFECANVTAC